MRGGDNYSYGITKKNKKDIRATLKFEIQFPYDDDEICLCDALPYTYSDLLKSIEGWNTNNFFKFETLCKTLGGEDCPILTLTSSKSKIPYEKRKYIFITGRIHPGESNSSYLVKGFINYLLSNTPEANFILENTIIKCVPMINIDGVIEGFYRVSLSGDDLNRIWTSPDSTKHPVIYHTKELIHKISKEREIIMYLDFHGHSRLNGTFIYGCPNDNDNALRNSEKIYPRILSYLKDTFLWSYCVFSFPKERKSAGRIVIRNELNIVNSYTIETSFGGIISGELNGFLYDEVTWENIGSKCALAFYHFLIGEKSDIFRYSKKEISLHFTKSLKPQKRSKRKLEIDMKNTKSFVTFECEPKDVSTSPLNLQQPKWKQASFFTHS